MIQFIFFFVIAWGQVSYSTKLPQKPQIQNKSASLSKLKEHFYEGSWRSCINLAPQVVRQHSQISDWIVLTWMRCLRAGVLQTQDISSVASFLRELKKIQWSSTLASEALIRTEFQALFSTTIDIKKSKDVKDFHSLLELFSSNLRGTSQQRALFYFELGSSYQEKFMLEQALWFYERAYKLNPTDDIFDRLNLIRTSLNKPKKNRTEAKAVYRSEEELKLANRVVPLLSSGDSLALAKEVVRYLKKFPMGAESERFESVLYQKLSDGSNQAHLEKARKVLLGNMLDAPAYFLEKWYKRSHRKGDYVTSQSLAEAYYSLNETPESLWITGRSAFYLGRYSEAEAHFLKLIEQYPKFTEIDDVLLKLAFCYIRLGKWSLAQSWFERIILLKPSSTLDLTARYWLIRVQEQLSVTKDKVQESKRQLIKQYPLSYYGLMIAREMGEKALLARGDLSVVTGRSYPALDWDIKIFDRLLLLAQNNWHDEAILELRQLDIPAEEGYLLRLAETFEQYGFYPGMTLVLNELDFSENSTAIKKEWLNQVYAKPFVSFVQQSAVKNYLDPVLFWSLMRQESLFLTLSESSSQAFGLMQIIPGTAREIAASLKFPILDWSLDGRRPSVNIEFGSYYLKELIKKMDNSIPMALAAYNYGPTRLKVWKSLRELSPWTDSKLSPFTELWIDELPAAETQFYVKAILRNILIYKHLDGADFSAEPGFWKRLNLNK